MYQLYKYFWVEDHTWKPCHFLRFRFFRMFIFWVSLFYIGFTPFLCFTSYLFQIFFSLCLDLFWWYSLFSPISFFFLFCFFSCTRSRPVSWLFSDCLKSGTTIWLIRENRWLWKWAFWTLENSHSKTDKKSFLTQCSPERVTSNMSRVCVCVRNTFVFAWVIHTCLRMCCTYTLQHTRSMWYDSFIVRAIGACRKRAT